MAVYEDDTIAAIATALAPSGIGIVRLSGTDAFAIADRIYYSPKGKKLADQKPYTIHYGKIKDQDEILDEVLVMLMRNPHSYTGEDTVEIDCHGGILSTRRVLEACIRNGARAAEPGEYTKRAFLNGRIDLAQAESVMDLIEAKNEYARKSSLKQLEGSLSVKIRKIRQNLLTEMARIEAALDDPEHLSLEGLEDYLKGTLEEQKRKIRRLLETSENGKLIREGIRTAIIGKPNAGKSSLLNRLVGEEKAIVTDIAGTTRDIVEETIQIKGISLKILDTAGIREARDQIEQIGVNKAKEQIREADLVLFVIDGSQDFDEENEKILKLLEDKKAILLLNKKDLNPVVTEEKLKKYGEFPILSISARTEEGIDDLEQRIEEMFFNEQLDFNDEVYLTNERHKSALKEAEQALSFVLDSMENHMPEDFWSIDLAEAIEALGRITGETLPEDLVNEIFSKFCMGK